MNDVAIVPYSANSIPPNPNPNSDPAPEPNLYREPNMYHVLGADSRLDSNNPDCVETLWSYVIARRVMLILT